MGPKNLRSVTWYLDQAKIRTWDHFLVITRVEIRTKKSVKGWAGWTSVSEGPSSRNLCSALDVLEMEPLCAKLKMEKDW